MNTNEEPRPDRDDAPARFAVMGADLLSRAREFARSVNSRVREVTGQAPPESSSAGLSGTAAAGRA
jgi:hypothetical protein